MCAGPADYFAGRLGGLDYDIKRDDVFIPANVAAEWFGRATGQRAKTAAATRALTQMHDEGRLWQLVRARAGGSGGKGFRWVGEYALPTDPIAMAGPAHTKRLSVKIPRGTRGCSHAAWR